MIDLAQADRTLRNTPTGEIDPGIEQRHRARCDALRANPLPFTTKKAALAVLTAADTVTATQLGGYCFEDWHKYRERVALEWRMKAAAMGATVRLTEDATPDGTPRLCAAFSDRPGVVAHITRPKFPRVRAGKLSATATRYTFAWGDNESSGSVADLKLSDDGQALELTMFSGAVMRYTVGA